MLELEELIGWMARESISDDIFVSYDVDDVYTIFFQPKEMTKNMIWDMFGCGMCEIFVISVYNNVVTKKHELDIF